MSSHVNINRQGISLSPQIRGLDERFFSVEPDPYLHLNWRDTDKSLLRAFVRENSHISQVAALIGVFRKADDSIGLIECVRKNMRRNFGAVRLGRPTKIYFCTADYLTKVPAANYKWMKSNKLDVSEERPS